MDNVKRNALGMEIMTYGGSKIPKIIAISGKFGTGKDTLVNLIKAAVQSQSDNPVMIHEHKFAGALKEATATMTGTTVEENYSDEGKARHIPELGMTLGRFQQVLGTVAREHIHPDIWIIPVIRACTTDRHSHPESKEPLAIVHLISDCRFINEALSIQKAGGIVIRLARRDDLISEKSKAGRDPNHISETCLDNYPNFDFFYQNDGTVDQMQEAVFRFLGFTN